MNAGTVVTFKGKNPITKSTFIGTVVQNDDEIPGNVLIVQGVTSLAEANGPEPVGGWTVVSRPESELTVINMYR